MSIRTKNPLHPSALSLNDLTVGREVIAVDVEYGIIWEGIIRSRPYAASYTHINFKNGPVTLRPLLFDVLLNSFGYLVSESPEDTGVIPFGNQESWHPTHYLIDARKRHLIAPSRETTIDEESLLIERDIWLNSVWDMIENEEDAASFESAARDFS